MFNPARESVSKARFLRRLPGRFFLGCLVRIATNPAVGQTNFSADQLYLLPPIVVEGTNNLEETVQQHSPLAVTTLDGEQLEEMGIYTTFDLQRTVPNLSQSHAGLRSFSDNYVLRGLGNTEFLSDPAVVLYVDDAPFGDVVSYTTDLLDVDHVDVFRGPQGSRFGKNSEAGVINIVTRQPTDKFEADGKASYATFNTQQYQASAVGPLVKGKLYLSLAGQYATSDGFIHNTFLNSHADEQEGINGRASLHWMPVENWQVDFTATSDNFNDGIGIVSLNGNPRRTMSEFDGKVEERANSQSLRVHGQLSNLAVTSITARHDFQLDPLKFDLDFTPLTGNTGIVKNAQVQWSEEVRIEPVVENEKWNWHAGFFFSTAETHIDRPTDFFIPPLGLSGTNDIATRQNSDNYALFGELTYKAGDKFDITLGLRLDYAVREMHRTHVSTFGSPPPTQADADFFNAAPKLTLAYHISDSLLVYGSTGVGFKPGGFSPTIDPPASPKFDTETAWASEIGMKSKWLDGKLTANAALFYYDVTDYQVEQFAPASLDFTVANAPGARTLGVEMEVTARPAAGWELSGFFGYTDARLDNLTDPFTGVAVHHTHPPFVAEFNAGVAAQYEHKSGLFGRIEFSVVGDTFSDAANTTAFKQSAYGLFNARIGYEREHFGIFLFGENMTDSGYFTKMIPPLNAGAPGQPQTFGVMVTARY